jgi:hypothetical protein
MQMPQSVREHPWTALITSSGAILAVVTALFTVDARYAHAKDVESDKQKVESVIREVSLDLRKQMLEDKLFELDIKREQSPQQRLSPVDAALHSRYQRQLNELVLRQRK